MKVKGPGTTRTSTATIQSVHRRKLLTRSVRLGAAGLLANPLRMLALPQDAAKAPPEPADQAAQVHQKVVKLIVEHLDVDEKLVVPAARFKEDLGADSLDVVELVMACEEAFDIELPCEVEDTWKTVGDAERSILVELDKKKPAAKQ